MTDKVENIIDNINICEEIEDAVEAFTEAIKEHSIPRRAAFFGCIHILMRYGDQKKWTAQQANILTCTWEKKGKSVKSFKS